MVYLVEGGLVISSVHKCTVHLVINWHLWRPPYLFLRHRHWHDERRRGTDDRTKEPRSHRPDRKTQRVVFWFPGLSTFLCVVNRPLLKGRTIEKSLGLVCRKGSSDEGGRWLLTTVLFRLNVTEVVVKREVPVCYCFIGLRLVIRLESSS